MEFPFVLVRLLFVFNFILFCLGVYVCLFLASSVQERSYHGENKDLRKLNVSQSYKLFIIPGVIISLISFLGCFGAFFESESLLKWYMYSILLFIIPQVAILWYSHADSGLPPKQEVNRIFEVAMRNYRANMEYKKYIDDIQSKKQCCGADYARNWKEMGMESPPPSCCPHSNDECTYEKAFEKNCVDTFDDPVTDTHSFHRWNFGGMIVFQVIVVLFTWYARINILKRQRLLGAAAAVL